MGYSPWGHKESDLAVWLTLNLITYYSHSIVLSNTWMRDNGVQLFGGYKWTHKLWPRHRLFSSRCYCLKRNTKHCAFKLHENRDQVCFIHHCIPNIVSVAWSRFLIYIWWLTGKWPKYSFIGLSMFNYLILIYLRLYYQMNNLLAQLTEEIYKNEDLKIWQSFMLIIINSWVNDITN